MYTSTSLMLFRQDLRVRDNPALTAAAKAENPLMCLYVWDPKLAKLERPGSASQWWLQESLIRLDASLKKAGNSLALCEGRLKDIFSQLTRRYNISQIFLNQACEPTAQKHERDLQTWATEHGTRVFSYNGNLLFDPRHFHNQNGNPYTVFTPFWNRLHKTFAPGKSLPAPRQLPPAPPTSGPAFLSSFQFPPLPSRAQSYSTYWDPGEDGALNSLKSFMRNPIMTYQIDRDRPDRSQTSRLSPSFHYGELSPTYVWRKIQDLLPKISLDQRASLMAFQRQLAWREFAQHLLFHFPDLPKAPLRTHYHQFPWKSNTKNLEAWRNGQTGYPLVDAGMRELWNTGWMHNRVRMVVASFLTKHLLLPWQKGAEWFWETLVDADLANNTLGWQWSAGCGPDAAPFFRIFNPVIQGQKFDPEGMYVRRWVPELSALPNRYIHQPWDAPQPVLKKSTIALGRTYPFPIVDHRKARERALATFRQFQHDQTVTPMVRPKE